MRLDKLFTWWEMQGIKSWYKTIYDLEDHSLIYADVNTGGLVSAKIIYRVYAEKEPGPIVTRMIDATIYFGHDATVFIRNANLKDLGEHIHAKINNENTL
jgi:hypothetical protein